MRIVVLDGYRLNPGDNPWDAVERLGTLTLYDRTSQEQIGARSCDADILITNKVPLDADVLRSLPRLKLIAVTATGFNVVDTAVASARGVIVSNVPEYGTETVAQYTLALLLELCHRVGLHAESVVRGEWERCADWCYWLTPQMELSGKAIGIVGFGRIGRRVAELARVLGMTVLAFNRSPKQAPDFAPFRWVSIEELFAQADVVSLHCPQTAENTEMVNHRLLSLMKPTAIFINTARGGLVGESDLARALNEGRLAGAALDVVSMEPIRRDNPCSRPGTASSLRTWRGGRWRHGAALCRRPQQTLPRSWRAAQPTL